MRFVIVVVVYYTYNALTNSTNEIPKLFAYFYPNR